MPLDQPWEKLTADKENMLSLMYLLITKSLIQSTLKSIRIFRLTSVSSESCFERVANSEICFLSMIRLIACLYLAVEQIVQSSQAFLDQRTIEFLD